jgi:hypothetical protein
MYWVLINFVPAVRCCAAADDWCSDEGSARHAGHAVAAAASSSWIVEGQQVDSSLDTGFRSCSAFSSAAAPPYAAGKVDFAAVSIG